MSLIDPGQKTIARSRNFLHSLALVGGIGSVTALSAYALSGTTGVIWALVTIAVFVALGPRVAPDAVVRMFGGKRVDPARGGPLIQVLAELTRRAGLPSVPRLYVIPSATLNAFATGSRSSASIAITDGMLRRLELHEIAAVLAHEVAHVRNNDLWVMSLADMMSRITRFLSIFAVVLFFLNLPLAMAGGEPVPWLAILLLYLAPSISSLLQLGLSRSREYDADLGAAALIGSPASLISALAKLERYQGRFWEDLFMPGRRNPGPSLLRSHPPTARRIERLMALQRKPGLPPMALPQPHMHVAGLAGLPARPRYHWSGYWY
jgi:heat shock protein HtpX